ncbi:hypothetical protein H310_14647 [Aphanomyces invadans]|uniref:Uncharacterized protein n=1 Tax=Aphanomyces invadans TaxID=157072 RepID=A0A024TB84_9STRA|nr:hypothetical protein H310_14647 [Aphanomyces invadans]ETV90612.1 hypothetical protein H310_14647 [Aphanomyces invadans]|eukprot:XP_008880765.1 hypothetical protein H310_14647 [Aphanomyces invadans]
MNLVYVYYDDADYLDTHKVDYTKCVGLDVATSYLDESTQQQELLLGCVPWTCIGGASTMHQPD